MLPAVNPITLIIELKLTSSPASSSQATCVKLLKSAQSPLSSYNANCVSVLGVSKSVETFTLPDSGATKLYQTVLFNVGPSTQQEPAGSFSSTEAAVLVPVVQAASTSRAIAPQSGSFSGEPPPSSTSIQNSPIVPL